MSCLFAIIMPTELITFMAHAPTSDTAEELFSLSIVLELRNPDYGDKATADGSIRYDTKRRIYPRLRSIEESPKKKKKKKKMTLHWFYVFLSGSHLSALVRSHSLPCFLRLGMSPCGVDITFFNLYDPYLHVDKSLTAHLFTSPMPTLPSRNVTSRNSRHRLGV